MTKAEQKFHMDSHKAAAEHCATMGKCHAEMSKCHDAIAKASEMTDPDASASHQGIADAHKDAAASCAKAGQHHLDACDQLDAMKHDYGTDGSHDSDLKVILGELQKLTTGLPTGLSAIPRQNNPVLVPRPGQPRVEDHDTESAKAAVDPALKDVIFDPRQARG